MKAAQRNVAVSSRFDVFSRTHTRYKSYEELRIVRR